MKRARLRRGSAYNKEFTLRPRNTSLLCVSLLWCPLNKVPVSASDWLYTLRTGSMNWRLPQQSSTENYWTLLIEITVENRFCLSRINSHNPESQFCFIFICCDVLWCQSSCFCFWLVIQTTHRVSEDTVVEYRELLNSLNSLNRDHCWKQILPIKSKLSQSWITNLLRVPLYNKVPISASAWYCVQTLQLETQCQCGSVN